jgi:hypothetical protein
MDKIVSDASTTITQTEVILPGVDGEAKNATNHD